MKDKTVAILESRMRDHIASLVRKYGGTPFSAPALAEMPDVNPAHIDALIRDWNFTSASQASNLFTVTQIDGKQASLKQSLGRTLVASIGPVCSVALRKLAVRVDIEAKPPKLGPFIEAINAALSDLRPLSKS